MDLRIPAAGVIAVAQDLDLVLLMARLETIANHPLQLKVHLAPLEHPKRSSFPRFSGPDEGLRSTKADIICQRFVSLGKIRFLHDRTAETRLCQEEE